MQNKCNHCILLTEDKLFPFLLRFEKDIWEKCSSSTYNIPIMKLQRLSRRWMIRGDCFGGWCSEGQRSVGIGRRAVGTGGREFRQMLPAGHVAQIMNLVRLNWRLQPLSTNCRSLLWPRSPTGVHGRIPERGRQSEEWSRGVCSSFSPFPPL